MRFFAGIFEPRVDFSYHRHALSIQPANQAVPMSSALTRDALEAFWMPFTANRQFKNQPRLLARAEGMHYWTPDGRKVLDGCAGLWCVNAGHGRKEITAAVAEQMATLDYAPAFQMGHPAGFELANRLVKLMPGDLNHVFFTNSGSESVDTALKIAVGYHRIKGDASRQRLIGREKGYHGVGFGGISVGGLSSNRKFFDSMLLNTDHLRHTLDIEHNAFTRGLPEWGTHLADDLERLVTLHDASSDRRGHRRTDGGLRRRHPAAEGLFAEAARDL